MFVDQVHKLHKCHQVTPSPEQCLDNSGAENLEQHFNGFSCWPVFLESIISANFLVGYFMDFFAAFLVGHCFGIHYFSRLSYWHSLKSTILSVFPVGYCAEWFLTCFHVGHFSEFFQADLCIATLKWKEHESKKYENWCSTTLDDITYKTNQLEKWPGRRFQRFAWPVPSQYFLTPIQMKCVGAEGYLVS